MRPGRLGELVLYRTDGRNGLIYDLPAVITVTPDSHPGDYPDGRNNPLPVPDEGCVHLTVFTPGGFGTTISGGVPADTGEFVGAAGFNPGSGTYVELNVPGYKADIPDSPPARTWRRFD